MQYEYTIGLVGDIGHPTVRRSNGLCRSKWTVLTDLLPEEDRLNEEGDPDDA